MLSTEEVKHIAKLARIGLDEKDVEKYRVDLSAVLDSFKELESVDVSGVDAFGLAPGLENALREDTTRVAHPEERKNILNLFPRREGESLEVKSVF